MNNLYRDILKRAWKICIRHKFLWIFGIFAAFLGNGGEYEILFRNVNAVSQHQATIEGLKSLSQTGTLKIIATNMASFFANNTASTLIWSLFVLAALAFVIWIIIISQAALIGSVEKISAGKKVTLESGFKMGKEKFAPVFVLNLISRVLIYGLLIIIGVPLGYIFISRQGIGWESLFTISSFVILVPLAIIISFVVKYASAYVVLKNQVAQEAFVSGWKLFWKNWLISLEMAVILFLFTIVGGLAMILAVALVALPFILLTFLFMTVYLQAATLIIAILGTIACLATMFIFGAFIASYIWSSWTLLFLRISKGKEISKIVRIFHRPKA